MTDNITPHHLLITVGPGQGRIIEVPPGGGRIGRSKENDIVLSDDSLSRFHCRVFFKEGTLAVADLASTNETLVNGGSIQERMLSPGDRIEIGETILRVLSNQLDGSRGASGGPVDLGFKPMAAPTQTRLALKPLPMVLTVAIVLVAGALLWKLSPSEAPSETQGQPSSEFAIRYEKVEADKDNIFRYALSLEQGMLSARVDGLSNNRHISRESAVDPRLLSSFSAALKRSGFFQLQKEYAGLTQGTWNTLDLEIVLDGNVHRSKVLNRLEPEGFQAVREQIEEFAQNELGLAALAMPPEKLLALADEGVQLGRKLFDERAIANGNLYRALQTFKEAAWYLETMDPKPKNYALALAGEKDSQTLLNEWIADYEFRAERAIKLTNWPEAARELKAIIEQLPDPSDDRYKKAQRKLLDVERRMNR